MKVIRDAMDPMFLIAGAILLVVACPFLAIGGMEAMEARRQIRTFTQVMGVVVDNTYQTSVDSEGVESGAYYPVVKFVDFTGDTVRFTDGIGSLPPDYQPDEAVQVLYNPENVREARIYSWKRMWLFPTIFMGVGGLVGVGVPVWFLLLLWRGGIRMGKFDGGVV